MSVPLISSGSPRLLSSLLLVSLSGITRKINLGGKKFYLNIHLILPVLPSETDRSLFGHSRISVSSFLLPNKPIHGSQCQQVIVCSNYCGIPNFPSLPDI